MLAKISSSTVSGVDGIEVVVEVDISLGLPFFSTVGLPDRSVHGRGVFVLPHHSVFPLSQGPIAKCSILLLCGPLCRCPL